MPGYPHIHRLSHPAQEPVGMWVSHQSGTLSHFFSLYSRPETVLSDNLM